jgi:hypothetical protein
MKAEELDRVADEVANYEVMLAFDSMAELWRDLAAYAEGRDPSTFDQWS